MWLMLRERDMVRMSSFCHKHYNRLKFFFYIKKKIKILQNNTHSLIISTAIFVLPKMLLSLGASVKPHKNSAFFSMLFANGGGEVRWGSSPNLDAKRNKF